MTEPKSALNDPDDLTFWIEPDEDEEGNQTAAAEHAEFCLWPLHPGPCKESGSEGGGGGGERKKTGADAKKKTTAPTPEQEPAQAPGRGVVDALLREKFLDTPQTVNNDTTPEDRQAAEEQAKEQDRVAARRQQRAQVRERAAAARQRYGPRSKWPKRIRANVEREEKRVAELSSQTAATSLTACGCASRAGVSEFSVATDGSTCACDPDGAERPMSAGGEFCACSGGSQTAAVRSDFDDMPIADRDTGWDVGAAEAAISQWATNADGDIDFDRYGRAFLYRNPEADPQTKQAYKFPVATVVDGELTIVPHAVFAAAARLDQADVSADAKDALRVAIMDLYDQMADEFDDDSLEAPWEMAESGDELEHDLDASGDSAVDAYGADVHGGEFCGTCGGDPLDQVAAAYGVFGDIPPHPIERFQRTAAGPTPMTILEDGSVFGHIAPWDSCNRGVKGRCLPPPRSKTNYAQFHTVPVRTTEGTLRVGKIVMGEGHADVSGNMQVTRAWYDKHGKTVAHGRAHEDKWGIFFSGVVGPGVSPQEAVEFFSMPPSGHWTEHRPTRSSELIAVAAVNVQGHPVPGPDLVLNQVASGYFEPADTDVADAAAVFAILDQADWTTEAAALVERLAL